MPDETPIIVTMKLDAEDYENIYLRVRGKLWVFLASMFAVLGGGGLFAFYSSVSTATEKAVNKYVQTETFKQNIIQAAAAKTVELKQRTDAIEANLNTSEKRVATLAKLPISVGSNGITMMDASGEKFFIETGVANDGVPVKFHNPYKVPPMVILNATGDQFGSYNQGFHAGSKVSGFAPNVTTQGFSVPAYSVNRRTYNWIALGQ